MKKLLILAAFLIHICNGAPVRKVVRRKSKASVLRSRADPRADPIAMCTAPVHGTVFVKHPSDCSKFFICHGLNGFMIDCPAGTLWDESLNICNHSYQVNCDEKPERNRKALNKKRKKVVTTQNTVPIQRVKPRPTVTSMTTSATSSTTTTTTMTTSTTIPTIPTTTTTSIPTTTSTATSISELPICPSDQDEGSSVNIRNEEVHIPFETCLPLPACPTEESDSSSIDLRGANEWIAGYNCLGGDVNMPIVDLQMPMNLPLCTTKEGSSIDLRSNEIQIPFKTCLPACPPKSTSSIDLRGINDPMPGFNCIEVPADETVTATDPVEEPLDLPLCPSDDVSGGSIDLRSGGEHIPYETCLPACPPKSASLLNVRGADDLIPGVDCIKIQTEEEVIDEIIATIDEEVIDEALAAIGDEIFDEVIETIDQVEKQPEPLALCPSDDASKSGGSIDLRSGGVHIPYETCLPACPQESESLLDIRGAEDLIPGVDCIKVEPEEIITPIDPVEIPSDLPLCKTEDESSIDLRSNKVQIPFKTCLPACPPKRTSSIDLRGEDILFPGVNCIEVPVEETITPEDPIEEHLDLPLCPSDDVSGGSIDLRSGGEHIPYETCLPACPPKSASLFNVRGADDLIPGVDCIEVPVEDTIIPEDPVEEHLDLPLCPSDDVSGGSIDLRSGGEHIPYETCLPACPPKSASLLNVRGADDLIPGVDCIEVLIEETITPEDPEEEYLDLPLCPSNDESVVEGAIDLRSGGEHIPYETCLPACPQESESLLDIRGAEDLLPGVDCIIVKPEPKSLPLCPTENELKDAGSSIDLRSGGVEHIPYETCLPACPQESESLLDIRGAEDLIPGVDCLTVRS